MLDHFIHMDNIFLQLNNIYIIQTFYNIDIYLFIIKIYLIGCSGVVSLPSQHAG